MIISELIDVTNTVQLLLFDEVSLLSLMSPKNKPLWDFPGGPVVKTSPSNSGGADSIPGQGTKIPHASQPKNQNIKKQKQESPSAPESPRRPEPAPQPGLGGAAHTGRGSVTDGTAGGSRWHPTHSASRLARRPRGPRRGRPTE